MAETNNGRPVYNNKEKLHSLDHEGWLADHERETEEYSTEAWRADHEKETEEYVAEQINEDIREVEDTRKSSPGRQRPRGGWTFGRRDHSNN
jgi:hypothetical protein